MKNKNRNNTISPARKKGISEFDKLANEAKEQLIEKMRAKTLSRYAAPIMKYEKEADGRMVLEADTKDKGFAEAALLDTFGTASISLRYYFMREVLGAVCSRDETGKYEELAINAVIAGMHGINPNDEIEGMLASQMVATHFAALRLMKKMNNSETITQQDSYGNLATKLMRTYTAQIEALHRYRGKGQQKVTVEHVHVHSGGQAIVGNITHPQGGGVNNKNEEQPHAKQIEHAPMHKMPSTNTKRQPLPLPRNA